MYILRHIKIFILKYIIQLLADGMRSLATTSVLYNSFIFAVHTYIIRSSLRRFILDIASYDLLYN